MTKVSATDSKPLKTWIDERPLEVIINEVVLPPRTQREPDFGSLIPTSKYDYVADMITRDNKIFAGSNCIYDADVWHYESLLPSLQKEKELIEKEFVSLNEKMSATKKDSELQKLKEKLHELILKERENTIQLRETKEKLAYFTSVQSIFRKEFVTLNRIAKMYKENQDVEFLRKGAHWACSYSRYFLSKLKVPDGVKPISV